MVPFYSAAEYYELEREADYRSEYFQGEIFAMAGGSPRHSMISANLLRELGNGLKGKPCAPYESNMRLAVKATGLRSYPDASVYCGKLELDPEDPTQQTAINPTVLFEVLSPSTERWDRGRKAEHYRQIPSLKAYLLITQEKPHVELIERTADGSWRLREASGTEGSLPIECLGIDLELAGLYERVEFDPETPDVDLVPTD